MRERGFKALSLPDFDPAIHEETGTVPVVRWIPGASPGMTCTAGRGGGQTSAAQPAGEVSVYAVLRHFL